MTNLNHRKDIEHQERLVAEQKDIQAANYTELTRLRDISFNLDKDIDAQKKRVDMLHAEVDNNEHRIASISDMLKQKEDSIMRVSMKTQEAVQQIQDLKYQLNKLDGELGYFE